MNDIQVFNNPNFGSVRTILIDDEVWFVGKDVAERLGYTNPAKALADHVDDEDKLNNESLSSLGQRGGWLINDSGLYSLVLSSKLPSAKAFKRWITKEVIPSIQKTGSYSVINRQSLSPNTQALYGLIDTIAAMEIRQNKQGEQIKALDTTVSTMKEIMTEPLGDWKSDIKKRVVKIAQAINKDYKDVYAEMYGQLEVEAHISLSRRCDSKKARMEKAGNTKSAIQKGTTKLAIIYDDQKLRIIFENIVKKWAMRYCA